MGLKLQFNDWICVIVNIYFSCDYGNIDRLIEYRSNFSYLATLISTENLDEIIVAVDYIYCYPNTDRFLNEFSLFMENIDFQMTDILCMQPSSYTYIRMNQVCSTSWLDDLLTSNKKDIIYFYR